MDRLQDLADALDITMAELLGTDAQATEDERIAEYEEEIRGLKKKRALHIVSILCICTAAVLLTVLFVTLFNRIRDMEYSVQMLEGQVGSIYDNMDSRISEIVEQLKEQNSLVADCRIEPSVESVRGGMLELSARVTPAVWKEGMEAELILEGRKPILLWVFLTKVVFGLSFQFRWRKPSWTFLCTLPRAKRHRPKCWTA